MLGTLSKARYDPSLMESAREAGAYLWTDPRRKCNVTAATGSAKAWGLA